MKKNGCIHPALSGLLAYCGHGDQILIADGNYPVDANCPQSENIYLALRPGLPGVTDVLETLLEEINVEAYAVMTPDDGTEPGIFREFKKLLPGAERKEYGRFEFYDAAAQPKVRIAINTGEKRTYANILLTVGVA